ncbi:MAG: flavodoxin-dependent (E)-4-hydroxy-3-methylbut-2-enyl-diphosphate synthase [Eubacteriales bacterium]|nr:flavodoxin-dependent (E)-4-hydroxy-3-methylbut-2-enyl-diphosphate synthase [Eubacteriales bacterium]MDD4389799.1 flavodoxin-dependent (E)-4-hydroxy-3-methylbut-2-enyl-diphosphate synthase [Eubacteriales bacterium]
MSSVKRRETKKVFCGAVAIGGNAPISIQSMTNTHTSDIKATVSQIRSLAEAGAQIVRLAVPDNDAAKAFESIKKELQKYTQTKDLPLVADIHFDYRLAIQSIVNGADKVRINPGNIGDVDRIKAVVDAASERNIPIRIGVNSGSLKRNIIEKYGGVTAEGLVESALDNIRTLEDINFDNIVVSIKSSDVMMNYDAHILLAKHTNYPMHIGLTEAGTATKGKIKSAVGLSPLLIEGIGDTMRISLTGDPVQEVYFAREILEAIGIRGSGIRFVSCPTCGRTAVDLNKIALQIENALAPVTERRKNAGMRDLTIAIMGCAVNGPGEARESDLGVACGEGKGVIFAKGEILCTVAEADIANTIIELVKKQ